MRTIWCLVLALVFCVGCGGQRKPEAETHELVLLPASDKAAPAPIGGCSFMVFSQDGKRLATLNLRGQLRVWDTATGAEELRADLSGTRFTHDRIAFPAPDRIVMVGLQGTMTVPVRAHANGVHGPVPASNGSICDFTPDAAGVLVIGLKDAVVWNLREKRVQAEISREISHESALSPRLDALIHRDLRGASVIVRLGQEPPWNVEDSCARAFSPDGSRVSIGTWNGTILTYDVSTGERAGRFRNIEGQVVALASDGKRVAAVYNSEYMEMCRIDGTAGWKLRSPSNYLPVIALSPDGRLLAFGDDKLERPLLFDAATGAPVK